MIQISKMKNFIVDQFPFEAMENLNMAERVNKAYPKNLVVKNSYSNGKVSKNGRAKVIHPSDIRLDIGKAEWPAIRNWMYESDFVYWFIFNALDVININNCQLTLLFYYNTL